LTKCGRRRLSGKQPSPGPGYGVVVADGALPDDAEELHFRRVATRYDKFAADFFAMVQLASMACGCALMNLRARPS
jgi:hypothetical protein